MKVLLALVLTLLAFSLKGQNCHEVKTGIFIIEDTDYGGSILIRNETTQEEIVEQLGIHVKYDLIWTDACSYALFNATSMKEGDPYPYMEGNETDTLFVEIIKILPNGYEFSCSSNFSDFVTTGAVKRK